MLTADSHQGKALTFLDIHETFFSPTGAGVPNVEDQLGYDAKPLKICSAIEMMYQHLKVAIKIESETAEIPQTIGVRQGDNLSPSMGINKNLWNCPHTDMFSKYQLFLALVVTQLLWGCESWALKETSLNDVDVFLHQSIRRIIGIRISHDLGYSNTNNASD